MHSSRPTGKICNDWPGNISILSKIQIFVGGDKLIKRKNDNGEEATLEETLVGLAESIGLPYREIELR